MKKIIPLLMVVLTALACKTKVTNNATQSTFKDVDVTEAQRMIQEQEDLIILDVRTPEETAQGTLPNAIVIDVMANDFDEKISILNKEKPYLVYCKMGGRSVTASNKMIEAGFVNVTNMKGGYTAWTATNED